MYTILEIKNNITPMLHSGSLGKVRSFEEACERAANMMLSKIKLLETIRIAALTQTVHDNLFDYALPSDFYSMIDLYPQSERQWSDKSQRVTAMRLDLKKLFSKKQISIEGKEGSKNLRISWKVRSPKTANSMNSYDGNGTFSAVGTTTNIVTDTIIKYSGAGSVKFTIAATGDGIQTTDMTAIDLTNEDELADIIFPVYLSTIANLTSITPIWGNDLAANYWTAPAQTSQADGTAFRVGWNLIKAPWATATETGTVAPATIDSLKFTFQLSSPTSITARIDNVQFSIGYPFDVKYYSKFLFRTNAGTFETRPTSDDDSVVCDNDSIQIFLLELLKAIAHQLEGTDSAFDITFAEKDLEELYQAYRGEHGDESIKKVGRYSGLPRFERRL
jgi:hypothetical protein